MTVRKKGPLSELDAAFFDAEAVFSWSDLISDQDHGTKQLVFDVGQGLKAKPGDQLEVHSQVAMV